jgi:hypothetical protein
MNAAGIFISAPHDGQYVAERPRKGGLKLLSYEGECGGLNWNPRARLRAARCGLVARRRRCGHRARSARAA